MIFFFFSPPNKLHPNLQYVVIHIYNPKGCYQNNLTTIANCRKGETQSVINSFPLVSIFPKTITFSYYKIYKLLINQPSIKVSSVNKPQTQKRKKGKKMLQTHSKYICVCV